MGTTPLINQNLQWNIFNLLEKRINHVPGKGSTPLDLDSSSPKGLHQETVACHLLLFQHPDIQSQVDF